MNQAPFGTKDGKPCTTPRLEGYEAALRIYEYPREDWPLLVELATYLHRVVQGVEKVEYVVSGRRVLRRQVTPDMLEPPDGPL